MKAIRLHQHGGADALLYEDAPMPEPMGDQVLIRVIAAGINFMDIYQRTGLYPVQLPYTLGQEGCGIIEAVGPDVEWFNPGQRVAWAQAAGSYAEYVVASATKIVKVPEEISSETAAAVMLQGMTAHYLATSTYPLHEAETCLVYAAAGGVGLLLTQIAKLRGAIVIGVTSSDEKAKRATAAGADHIIRYDKDDVAKEVKKLTSGRGIDVAYDSVGKATWQASIDSLRPRGMMVSYGNASGPVGSIDPLQLTRSGSLFLTRPTLAHYIATRVELEWRANELFSWIAHDRLQVHIHQEYPLAQAAQAQQALESRQTTGKLLLKT